MKNDIGKTNLPTGSLPAESIKTSSLFKQKGASAIEYAVIAALIVVALWAAVSVLNLSDAFSSIFNDVAAALGGAAEGGGGD